MAHIVVRNLVKTFRIAARRSGIAGAVAGLMKRTYRRIYALDDVSFSIQKGELVGYIGPNGAGKSTTVKILSGILVPEAGGCEVDGRIPWKNRIAHVSQIGVVFGQRTQLWWDLPVIESFDLLRDIYRLSDVQYRAEKDLLIELLKLQLLLDVPVRQLSLGQRMRCDLAAALLHRPQILFLDEPTIGLDAISKLAVRDFVKVLNRERNVTVILTTHDMDDSEALCQRLIVISKGFQPHLCRTLACVNYFSVLLILEKPDPLGTTALFQGISPVAGLFFLLAGVFFWNFGLRYYASTGS